MADQPGRLPSATAAPPLFGREREIAALREALTSALAGRGSLVLIDGEAGIGKTALVRDIAREARMRGAAVLVGRAFDLREPPPYGIWLDFLGAGAAHEHSELLADVRLALQPAVGQAGGSQTAVFEQVFAEFARQAGGQPLVCVLDDLHWADAASLDLLRFAARQLAMLPFLIVGTYRADEVAERHPLAKMLPALVREAEPVRLTVLPLAEGAIRRLVRADYALAPGDEARLLAYLRERTAGNPLYLGEVLRTLAEERLLQPGGGDGWVLADLADLRVPPLLRQVIAERLERLGADANRWLTAAAVIGHEVPLALWAAVAEAPEEELLALVERAAAARVLDVPTDGLRVQFHHPLIREALYERLSPPRRRAVHQRVGDLLVASAQPDPEVVARHFQQSSDGRAAEWLIRAGLRARRAAAWLSAADRVVAAAAVLAADEARARARAWLLYVSALLVHFSDGFQALRYLDEAGALAAEADDRRLAALIRLERGRVRGFLGEIRLGMAEMERGAVEHERMMPAEHHLLNNGEIALAAIAGLLPEGGPPAAHASASTVGTPQLSIDRGNLANWLSLAGHYREALARGEAFVAQVSSALGEAHLARAAPAYLGLGHAYAAFGQPDRALRAYGQARQGIRANRDAFMHEWSIWAELHMVLLPYRADDLAARAHLAAEAERAWERAGDTNTITPHGSFSELQLAIVEGRWAGARELAQVALVAPRAFRIVSAHLALGLLGRWQGEPDLAWAQVRALLPDGPDTEPGGTYFPHAIVAQGLAANLALDAGGSELAERWIAAHGRWLEWSGAVLWQADHQLLRARQSAAAGDHGQARQHGEAALDLAAAPRQPLALLAAQRLCGELAAAQGERAAAQTHFAAALTLAEDCAAPYERALTLLSLAELHWSSALVAEARAALDTGRAIFAQLGAAPALARADRLAAKIAFLRPAGSYPDGLTERELAVLRLVAAGRSNREAAAALAVSERTIERHLENLYRKLGARNRAEAVAQAARLILP